MMVLERFYGRRVALAALLAVVATLLALVPLAGTARAAIGEIETYTGDGLVDAFRFRGINRYQTAELIATEGGRTSDVALIARGDLYPDSLAGNYLAGQLGAPLLLTPTDSLVTFAEDALADLGVTEVIILGGFEAISEDVEDALAADYDVTRVGGEDRYETASLIASLAGNNFGDLDGLRTAVVASGYNFPDALVTGAISYDQEFPLLLTQADFLNPMTEDALTDLGIEQVLIPGGDLAVTPDVEDAIVDLGIDVVRIEGETRVETALAVAEFAIDNFGFARSEVMFARGDEFADALTVGPRQGEFQEVLLLTATPTVLEGPAQPVTSFLATEQCEFRRLGYAGGFAAISQDIQDTTRLAATSAGNCEISLTPESATNFVGETHTVTAAVTTNADGVPDETTTVTFSLQTATAQSGTVGVPATSTATPVILSTTTVTTSETGTATFSFTSHTPGTVTVTACITDADGDEVCTTATKRFVIPGESFLSVEGTSLQIRSVLTGAVETSTTLVGVSGTIVGLDKRPSTGQVFVINNTGQIYALTTAGPNTVGVPVGTPLPGFVSTSGVGFDFNPAADAIRVITGTGQNYRVSPTTGLGGSGTDANRRDSDLKYGAVTALGVTGAGYTNSTVPLAGTATATVLYDIDTTLDQLVKQDPPNAGTLTVIGPLGVNATAVNGFDISGDFGQAAYAALTVGGSNGLYLIDKSNGHATFIVALPSTLNLAALSIT